MIDYTLSIDLSGGKDPNGYFQINAISVDPFKEQQVDGMLTTRYSWGNVTVRNEPYKFAKLGGDRYKLYDILKSLPLDQEVHLKYESQYFSSESYFGPVDCKLDDDKKIITITPTTLDQYTAFLENRDNEVELFKENNLVVNSKFEYGTNNAPQSWDFYGWTKTSQLQFLEKKYINDRSAIAIGEYPLNQLGGWDALNNVPNLVDGIGAIGDTYICGYSGTFNGVSYSVNDRITYNGSNWIKSLDWASAETLQDAPEELIDSSFYQTINNVLKGRQVNLSFYYGLGGVNTDQKYNLKYRITLSDPLNPLIRYGLIDNGVGDLIWTAPIPLLTPVPTITYTPIPISKFPIGSVDLKRYSRTIAKTPILGNITIEFLRVDSSVWEQDVKLLLQDVNLSTSALELKTIRIEFNPDNLVTYDQSSDEIYWKGKNKLDKYFTRVPSDHRSIEQYINIDGNPFSPSYLNDKRYGITSDTNRTYANINDFFTDRNSKSYKFEISELTVYKGRFRSGNKRNWYATAKFSREQAYTMDSYDADTQTWIKNPPAEDVGWEDINVDSENEHRRLWVRSPFNGQNNGWTLGIIDHSESFRPSGLGFDYTDSRTTKKNYPIPDNKTREITNAIDLREILTKLYQGTDESLKGKQVKSSFLWNDEQDETIAKLIGLKPNTNYYTNQSNELNNIAVIHTFDLKDTVNKDEKNTYMVVSPKKFMDDLFNVYFPQCYWFIDNDDNLNIEHISFFDAVNSAKSLLEPKYNYLRNYHSWEYVKDRLFALEQYETTNSGYPDFKSAKVTFEKIATNKRGEDIKSTNSSSVISTDIQYCSENSKNIDSGLVLIAYSVVNGVNIANKGVGQKTGISLLNGQLSVSTLLDRYANYEGTWTEGLLNDKGNKANGKQAYRCTKRSKQGAELEIKGIFLDRVVLTDLGYGVISSRTIDHVNEKTNITALYRNSDNFIIMSEDTIIEVDDKPVVLPTLPTIATGTVANITENSATCNGTTLSEGSAPVTESGLVYGESTMPTIEDDTKIDISSGLSTFIATLSGLEAGTPYNVRAYAINSVGVAYGEARRFKTKTIIA